MTSASTLARRARAEKNPRRAKKLRAEANQRRREEREAKAFQASTIADLDGIKKLRKRDAERMDRAIKTGQHSGIVVGLKPVYMGVDEAANDSNAARAASVDSMPLMQQPGRGEIVGGKLASLADQFATLARKKGGIDEIQNQLAQMERIARYEGQRDAEERFAKERIAIGEAHRDRVVCAFLAKVETMEMMRNGIPKTAIVDGLTIAKVADVLHAAGYTAHGKR